MRSTGKIRTDLYLKILPGRIGLGRDCTNGERLVLPMRYDQLAGIWLFELPQSLDS